MPTFRPLALPLALCAGLAVGFGHTAQANAEVRVVVSVKPVHSLVASIMRGVGEPRLIVDGAGSPHTYSLKPSQAANLAKADLVFWIGHELEAFLEKPITSIAANAGSVELIETPDLTKRAFREGGPFEDHGHEDHDKDHDVAKTGDDDHDHDKDHDEVKTGDHDHDKDHDEAKTGDHDHDKDHDAAKTDDHDHDKEEDHAKTGDDDNHGHDAHGHAQFDPHIWLDPRNAGAMARQIEKTLSAADPDNAATYRSNLESTLVRLDALEAEVQTMLDPVKGKGFIVFHDAYQYFEARFGLNAAGSVTVNPDVMPGAERIDEILNKVRKLGATCVFAEPQFEPKLISVVMEGTRAKSGILDPLGAGLEAGPELYFELIREMANSIRSCLSEAG